jgi:hypothetical protein
MDQTKCPRASRAEWAKRVERWEDSGLTADQYAAELGINPRTLTYWKYILRRDRSRVAPGPTSKRRAPAAPSTVSFVEVTPPAKPTELVLEAPGGYRLVLPERVSTEQLARVLRALEQRA